MSAAYRQHNTRHTHTVEREAIKMSLRLLRSDGGRTGQSNSNILEYHTTAATAHINNIKKVLEQLLQQQQQQQQFQPRMRAKAPLLLFFSKHQSKIDGSSLPLPPISLSLTRAEAAEFPIQTNGWSSLFQSQEEYTKPKWNIQMGSS